MKQVKRRVQAGLLELRVFVDEPAISLRAQRGLIAANLNYLALALRPALWMAVPIGLLLIHLEAFYERAPLPLAEPALVTMRMTADWIPSAPPPVLIAPPNVAILGPPVRVAAAREVSWRILPYSPVSDKLLFRFNGQEVSKWIEAGDRQRYVTGEARTVALGNDTFARRKPDAFGFRRVDRDSLPGRRPAHVRFSRELAGVVSDRFHGGRPAPEKTLWRGDLRIRKCSERQSS